MGLLFSRFRKKKSTIDVLDEIDQKIKNIEEFQKRTEQKSRRIIGRLIVSSILIYVVALCGYYYYFSPDTFRQNILKFVPLILFPIIIIVSRKILSWYYRRQLMKNETALKTLKKKKVEILDEVTETEKYKTAREIFEKYAPERLNPNLGKSSTINGSSKALVTQTPQTTRQRSTPSTVSRKFDSPATTASSKPSGEVVAFNGALAQPRLSLPRPILPRDRGPFDKLVDMIIGDGPGNRYALICRMCSSHNGMALKHEFEYISFRCAYCMQWNPSRKQKPHAPHLALDSVSHDESDANNSEPDTIEYTNLIAESHHTNGDIDNKCESSAEGETEKVEETVEKGDGLETLESSKNLASDSVVSKIENVEPRIAAASNDIDLCDMQKSVEELSEDVSSAESHPLAESTKKTCVEGDTS